MKPTVLAKKFNMSYHAELVEALRDEREWLLDQIDGGEECRGRDTRISERIRMIERILAKVSE